MTFTSAISSLSDGEAAKPSNWRGYVCRVDNDPTLQAYDATKTTAYNVGDRCLYGGVVYQCTTQVTPSGSPAVVGAFDSSKWGRSQKHHKIIFMERQSGLSPESGSETTYAYELAATANLSSVTYGNPSPNMLFDGSIMTALFSDTWTIGPTSDFEAVRDPQGQSRW